MDPTTLEATRRTLHGVAELLLAGPQYQRSRTIRLQVTPGGFGTVAEPDLRIAGSTLVCPGGRFPLTGTIAGLARAAGVEPRALRDVYAEGPDVALDDDVVVDPDALSVLMDAFALGETALRAFAPDQERTLWPEHFDLAITAAEVNYGVSPGDAQLPAPYAYVGPWAPRSGSFWNTPFGAARDLSDLADAASLVTFFEEGAARAVGDPPHGS